MGNAHNRIEVPPAPDNIRLKQPGQEPTPYDYLGLLPTLLVAATPLILGLRKGKPSDPDKEDSKQKPANPEKEDSNNNE